MNKIKDEGGISPPWPPFQSMPVLPFKDLQRLHARMQHEDNWSEAGICDLLPSGAGRDAMLTWFYHWPHYSGNPTFPVPDPSGRRTPREKYLEGTPATMWDRSRPYAALRWNLLEWLIERAAQQNVAGMVPDNDEDDEDDTYD